MRLRESRVKKGSALKIRGLDEAVQLVARGVASHWQNLRLLQAVEVMEHAETQVFGVIADALRAAAGQVDDALDSDEVRSWPDHGHVPVHYQPSTVEFSLGTSRYLDEELG